MKRNDFLMAMAGCFTGSCLCYLIISHQYLFFGMLAFTFLFNSIVFAVVFHNVK
jgi:hypothetical protein